MHHCLESKGVPVAAEVLSAWWVRGPARVHGWIHAEMCEFIWFCEREFVLCAQRSAPAVRAGIGASMGGLACTGLG